MGRGENGPLCDPGSVTHYWEGERGKCEDNKWGEGKKINIYIYIYIKRRPDDDGDS